MLRTGNRIDAPVARCAGTAEEQEETGPPSLRVDLELHRDIVDLAYDNGE